MVHPNSESVMASQKPKTANAKKPRLKHVVCKPCWELKYCPYGPLVEFFPLPSENLPLKDVKRSYKSWLAAVKNGSLKTLNDIYTAIEKILCLEPRARIRYMNKMLSTSAIIK